MNVEIEVECSIKEGTARQHYDFIPRNKPGQNYQIVHIPAGEKYGFCDIEIVDDLASFDNYYYRNYYYKPSNTIQSDDDQHCNNYSLDDYLLDNPFQF